MDLLDSIIRAESGGDPSARNPNSSATGSGQFINQTWLDMIARNRPDLMQGRSQEEILALRNDPSLSREMTGAYARSNAEMLNGAGLPVTPGTTYLAHFAGPQGAIKILTSDPNAPAGSVMGEAAVKANPFLRNMTVARLKDWASGKVGGAGAMPAAQPSAAMPSASPDNSWMMAGGGTAAQGQQQAAPMALAPQGGQQQPDIPQTIEPTQLNMPLTMQAKQRMLAAIMRPRGAA